MVVWFILSLIVVVFFCFFFTHILQAVSGAHVIATDTWVSMGQEEEAAKRIRDYEGYQVQRTSTAVSHPRAALFFPRKI